MYNNIINRVKGSKLIQAFLITMFGSGLAKVISFSTIFITTHLLVQELFGQFSFVRNTLILLLGICALNFSSLCTKYTSEAREDAGFHRLFILCLFSLFLSMAISLGLWITPQKYLVSVFERPELVGIVKLFALGLPFFFIGPLLEGILRGLLRFKTISYIQNIGAVITFISIVGGTYFWGLTGAFVGLYIEYAAFTVLCIIPFIKKFNLKRIAGRLHGFISQYRIIYLSILPMFIVSFIEAPIFWLAQLILTKFGGFESTASMTVILQIRNLIMIIPGYFFSTFMAFASDMYAKRNYKEYYGKYHNIQRYLNIASIGGTILLGVFGVIILSIFGKEYTDSYTQYLWGIASLPLLVSVFLLRQHFIIAERQRMLLTVSILWNVIWLIILYAMVRLTAIDSLSSFFISQDIAVAIQLILLTVFFQKDKKLNIDEQKKYSHCGQA